MDNDQKIFEKNDVKRCAFLVKGEERCSRFMLSAQPGFCYGHAATAHAMKTSRDEIFRYNSGTMRCTAVSKIGSKCKFKALDNCVFCIKHIGLPPEKVSSVVFVFEEKLRKDNIGKNGFKDVNSTDDVESMGGTNHLGL